MPRAYYKPFTAYEEAFGFRATQRNAYIFCGLFFAGILFKCVLVANYSTVVESAQTSERLASNPDYQASLEQRVTLMESLSSQESMKKAIRRRREAPPA